MKAQIRRKRRSHTDTQGVRIKMAKEYKGLVLKHKGYNNYHQIIGLYWNTRGIGALEHIQI